MCVRECLCVKERERERKCRNQNERKVKSNCAEKEVLPITMSNVLSLPVF